ncbi:MAG: ECF transporter S component [Lachnospiraceae bacterium]
MNRVKKLVLSGILLAVALILPLFTGQIPQIGKMLSPMHIPILICGFACGWPYGLVIGAIAPILRFFIFGMPPLFPVGIAMMFELAAYGLCAGLFYKNLTKKTINIYISLLASMLIGRIVWGTAMFVIAGIAHIEFNFHMFLAGAFINAVPGIIAHIIIIPIIIIALKKAGYIFDENLETNTPIYHRN